MLQELQIKNFKSILDDTISLGKVNVFIGENGSGKSNVLEALLFASVAETYKTIDPDILYNNGFRVSKPSLIFNSFKGKKQKNEVEINLKYDNEEISYQLKPTEHDNIFSKWENIFYNIVSTIKTIDEEQKEFSSLLDSLKKENLDTKLIEKLNTQLSEFEKFKDEIFNDIDILNQKKSEFQKTQNFKDLTNFIIYTLNTEALRGIPEFQKSRKGIYGENLDLIINSLNKEEQEELKNYLYTISWIEDFFIDKNDDLKQKGYKLNYSKSLLYFRDKFMMKKNNVFSSENSNEGVLHVLFYLATIISSKTPRLFAIDNIETSLNPHLCQHTMVEICKLVKKYDKQILLTTHNPAILDGLNLFDDDIRLFEVFRTDDGDTRTRRIKLKPKVKGQEYKLSELWTRGFLGAISQKF